MTQFFKILFAICIALSGQAHGREVIAISNSLGPTHSGTPHVTAMIDRANTMQTKYQFVQEFRVGAFESISLRHILTVPNNSLAMITNTSAEAVDRGFVKLENYVPVFSQGDSCWMVIALSGSGTDLSAIKNLKEIVVGTPALGGATHLAALEIGKKYNIPVRMIVFRSNFDALVNMAANNGVNFVIERVSNFRQYQDKNSNMQMLAAQCPTRHPNHPEIKTLQEYSIVTPLIWQQLVASRDMDSKRRQELINIITQAEISLGREKIFALSDQLPPVFAGQDTEQHYQTSWKQLLQQRAKWQHVFRNQ
jgi:hypothetical protein